MVWEIQRNLQQLGYNTGVPDGIVGSRTISAARNFQRASGRQADGILGNALLRQLLAARGAGRLSRDMVQSIQQRLRALGYEPGAVDGLAGDRTAAAAREFQRASGEPPNGRLSLELLRRLKAASEKKG